MVRPSLPDHSSKRFVQSETAFQDNLKAVGGRILQEEHPRPFADGQAGGKSSLPNPYPGRLIGHH